MRFKVKADDRTRTDNLLITNQLLCQLSHIGIYYSNFKTSYSLRELFATLFFFRINLRSISIHQLNALPHLHLEPIYLIVYKGSYFLEGMGYLILRGASRLDAFSVYPCRTWLLCHRIGS